MTPVALSNDKDNILRKKIDDLILQVEPLHVTIFRGHYHLPYGDPLTEKLTDLEILIDNRRWKYVNGQLDADGDPIEREESGNDMDWIDEDDRDDSWLPDGPEFNLDQKALSHMLESGDLMADEKTKRRMLAEAADAELREMLADAPHDY